jgi:hypothetical protein
MINVHTLFPPEIINNDLVKFVEKSIRENKFIRLKAVPDGKKYNLIENPFFGYSPQQGLPLMSDPNENGLMVLDIDGKKIIYDPNANPLYKQRDSIIYAASPDYFVNGSFQDVLREFSKTYTFYLFKPNGLGDNLLRYKNRVSLIQTKIKIGLENII